MTRSRASALGKAGAVFRRAGGTLRMSEALRRGLSRRALYAMRDTGSVEQISRGVYRLKDLPPLGNPDLVAVALRVPKGVICLISALAYHDLTTQVPHEGHVAIERGSEKPRIDYPPVRFFRFSGRAFREGVKTHKIDGVRVRIYSPEKTVADCFKYRNKIGMDVALEALRLWRQRRGARVEALLTQARNCRVEQVMRPYLESLL
jgi:predicted transcriptional regulator of viral defense system